MPKLIDYPRTSYAGAWEVADVVDDTGGKCALDTCARKLNRKVSGSFKAIVGSAVKFGLLTSKRELLTTTTLFRRIKHAYDKQEELLFHREAFLTPPLFTQLCRKFRSRELPVQMLDIMLIREFDVEEINAQSVAKAFTDGARMVGLLDERNIVADIDLLAAQQPPRRELASPELSPNSFRAELARASAANTIQARGTASNDESLFVAPATTPVIAPAESSPLRPLSTDYDAKKAAGTSTAEPLRGQDAVSSLFGLADDSASMQPRPRPGRAASTSPTPSALAERSVAIASAESTPNNKPRRAPATEATEMTEVSTSVPSTRPAVSAVSAIAPVAPAAEPAPAVRPTLPPPPQAAAYTGFRIELSGPGLNTVLDVVDADDLALARALLEKIGRQLTK